MKNKTIIECDVSKMSVTPDGVADYQWPVSNTERTEFSIDMMYAYTSLIREQKNNNSKEILPYKILGARFLIEMVALFQGDLMRDRANDQGVTLSTPDHWQYWSKLFNETTPSEPSLLKELRNQKSASQKNNFKIVSFIQKVFKYFRLKKTNALGLIKIRPLTNTVLRDAIIALQRTPLIVQHAEKVKKEVVFSHSTRWFKEISDTELEKSILINDKILESKILEVLEKAYAEYGIKFKPHSRDYIHNLVTKGAAMVRVHYQRLLENKTTLPSEIWAGTSNQFWDSILRSAVKECGGTVTGHDHGSGWSYVTHPMRGINELWGCDYFMTFNDFHASEMTRMAPEWPLYENTIPQIIGSKNITSAPVKEFEKFKEGKSLTNKRNKTAFIMGNLYDNDRGRIGPGVPNNYLVDVQARMITQLKQAGYNVVLKMHPESKESPPASFETDLGAKIVWEGFTKIIEDADVVIFKCIYTTAFTDALATNVPIMVFDNFGLPWTEKGKELIEKRCSFYRAEYKDCRAQIDQDKFIEAVNAAASKSNNHEFYKTYFL